MIDARCFCDPNTFRDYIRNPVNYDGYLYVTDGRIGLQLPEDLQYEQAKPEWKWCRQLRDWVEEKTAKADLKPLPNFKEPKEGDCLKCHGDKIIYDDDDFEIECDECHGTGKTDRVPVKFNQLAISFYYLKKLKTLPNLKICVTGNATDMIPFIFDGGKGVLMGMRI